MIKHVKTYDPKALINSEVFREYLEGFESEIVRGISKLIILSVIKQWGKKGIYGYKLVREVKRETKNMLIIEEGTLYPILRKLKRDGLVETKKKEYNGRLRSYNIITQVGISVHNRLMGFYSKLNDSISGIIDMEVNLKPDVYFFCPNCSNRIELKDSQQRLCKICGLEPDKFQENNKQEM